MCRLVALIFLQVLFAIGMISPALAQDDTADWLDIELGKSMVLTISRTPSAVAITSPEVIFVTTLGSPNKLHIQGKMIGTTDLVVQFGGDTPPKIYEVTVHRDLSELIRRVDSIVEAEPPRVYPLEERIVVQGPVPDLDTLEQVALVAQVYDPEFVNLMTVQGDHQVQLEVVFAEVSRTALREMGIHALWGDDRIGFGLIGPTPSITTMSVVKDGVTSLSPVNTPGTVPGLAGAGFQIGAIVDPLDLAAVLAIVNDQKLGKILAQPTLVSLSGQQGEFLAGGELPIPSPSGQGAISLTYREYGVILVFVPTVLAGNVVDMRVTVEVSEPDPGAGTSLGGITVPGFATRRSKTHVRVEAGKTFAIAGMIAETTSLARAEIPGLGRLPVIGALFRYVKHQRDEREVVILATPRLVRPLGAADVPALPGTTENNNPSDVELFLLGMDHRPGSRSASPAPAGDIGLQR